MGTSKAWVKMKATPIDSTTWPENIMTCAMTKPRNHIQYLDTVRVVLLHKEERAHINGPDPVISGDGMLFNMETF